MGQPAQYTCILLISTNMSFCAAALNRVWPGLNASNPAASCTEILDVIPFAPSVNYWLRSSNGSTIHVFCNMTLFPCQPGFSEEERTCEGKSFPGSRRVMVLL